MKRRVISLLAILVMLCTMVVVVAPTATAAEEDYTKYPAFSTYPGSSGDTNWTINNVNDWKALINAANNATGDYLSGHTLHLTTDINFSATLNPVGYSNKTGAFAGTINGHGNGIGDFVMKTTADKKNSDKTDNIEDTYDSTTETSYVGLFWNLGDCQFIDFGLNSGIIYDAGGSVMCAISSFGRVMPGKTPKFTRVWSSAALGTMAKGTASGLVHTVERNAIKVDVNGFVFDGDIVKTDDLGIDGQWSFAVSGSTYQTLSSGNKFANIITDCSSRNGIMNIESGAYTVSRTDESKPTPGVRTALFNFDTVANFKAANKGNVYAVKRAKDGVDEGYFLSFRSGYGASGSEEIMTDMSAAEVAWTINSNPTSVEKDGVAPVYYTLNDDGKVRPIPEGKSDGKIIKVTLDGMRKETYFFNAGQELNLTADLNKNDAQTFAITKGTGSTINDNVLTLGANDITIEVGKASSHSHQITITHRDGKHTRVCEGCGYKQVDAACKVGDDDTYTQDPIITLEDLLAGGVVTHSGTCSSIDKDKKPHTFTQACTVKYKINKDKDNAWTFSDCKCGRKDEIVHTGVRGMLAGDVNVNGTVDARDAIAVLKKVAQKNTTFNERNANVDENYNTEAQDAYTIILRWLGDKKTITDLEEIEDKVNKENHYNYNAEDVKVGNLKMDGKRGTNDRYVRTETAIAVKEGDTIVFGPVRMQQAVMGYFYKDNSTTALSVINRNADIEVVYEFADGEGMLKKADLKDAGETVHDESLGLVMASIVVPEGAAFVRFNVNAEEKDKYYIRINDEFSIGAYKSITKVDVSTLGNPLKNQFVLNMGDSLADGSGHFPYRDGTPDGRLTAWSRRIMQQFGAKVVTSAQGGSLVSSHKITNNKIDLRQCILNQLNEHSNSGREYEYILLEGGGNDCNAGAAKGTFDKDDYNPDNFAPANTYAGALERLIFTAIQEHGDTAALGYFIPYDMKHVTGSYESLTNANEYFNITRQICEKWDVPVLDLFEISEENEDGTLKGTFNSKMNTEKFRKFEAGKVEKSDGAAAIVEQGQKESWSNDEIAKKVQEYVNQKVEEAVEANVKHIADDGKTYDGVHATDEGHDVMFTYIKPFMLKMKPVRQDIYAKVQEYVAKKGELPTYYKNYQ